MRAVVLALVLVGCGPPPDLVSDRGVEISFMEPGVSWTLETVNEQEVWFIDQVTQNPRYDRRKVEEAFGHVRVDVYVEPIKCGSASPNGLCNGLQYGTYLQIRDMGCVANSAYTHEIMHWLQESLHREADYNHTEPDVWSVADGSPHGCTP